MNTVTRSMFFRCGHCIVLMLVGTSVLAVTQLIHQLGRGLMVSFLISMSASMLVQMALALAVAPILGFTRCMVSSMVVAMVGPMAVCVFPLFNMDLTASGYPELGAAFGLFIYLVLEFRGYRQARLQIAGGSTENPSLRSAFSTAPHARRWFRCAEEVGIRNGKNPSKV